MSGVAIYMEGGGDGKNAKASYSKWIDIEIDLAERGLNQPKPIIAIEPRGSERTSVRVKQAADRIVGWNTESIVNAIRELA